HKLNVQGSEEELRQAVQHCSGHAFALTLLASLLRNRHLSLRAFFSEPSYAQVWSGNVARNLLNQIYREQLDIVQRKLLIAFCVYREPVPLEAARAVVDTGQTVPRVRWQQALDALLAQHLLQPEGEGLYQLHTIVVGFANDHFVEEDEEANTRELHQAYSKAARYYRHYAARYCPPLEQRKSVGDVHALIEATWALCQAEQWQEAYELMEMERLYSDLRRWGNNGVLFELYQLLLPLQKWQPGEARAAHIYNDLGEICRGLGQMEQARKYYEQALELSREASDPHEEGRALSSIGRSYNDTMNKRQALPYYEEALKVYRLVNNLGGRGDVLLNVGWTYYDLALMEKAHESFKEALDIYRQMGERGEEARALNSIGRVYMNLGKLDIALQYHEQALHLAQEERERSIEATALNCLGRTYEAMSRRTENTDSIAQEHRRKAIDYYHQALAIRHETGNRWGESAVLDNLAITYHKMGEYHKAHEYYEKALVVRREVGNRNGEAKTLAWMGWLYRDTGQLARAIAHFKMALAIRRATGQHKHEAKTLSWLGQCCLEAGDNALALACFILALELFAQLLDLDPDAIQRAEQTKSLRDDLRQKLGDEQFELLTTRVEPQAKRLVYEALEKVGT
ncbi:MAG: tetratricopeptide repeat protein, partial [Ktedonobacteraceae bacterium]|nr:tetratricopeptide repeat protein [Ktedonobacteraceae bacterium]